MYSICAWDEGNLVEQNKFNMLGIVQLQIWHQQWPWVETILNKQEQQRLLIK